MQKPTTPAQYILILIDLIEKKGYDRDKLLVGTSLANTGISGIGARVSDEDFTRLVLNAFNLTGDTALGLQLGMRLNLGAHAVLGQAFMTCKDLREVMELFLKYYHLLSSSMYLEFEIQGKRSTLTSGNSQHEISVEFSYELTYAGILNTLRGLLNLPDIQLRIELPYPEPAHVDQYSAIFGDDVHFNCSRGQLSFDSSLLDTELPSSNPALRSLYEEECARLLVDLEGEDSMVEQTLRLLRKLEGQYPQMPQIASMLNLSPRTYRRRLEQEDHAYQALLDMVRTEHATHYLKNTKLPLSTIAYMVGFSDASNFRRAYTRWTGHTPGIIRSGD